MKNVVEPKPVKLYNEVWYPTDLASDDSDFDSLARGAIMSAELDGNFERAEALKVVQRQAHREAFARQQQNTAYSPLGWSKYAVTRGGQLIHYPEAVNPTPLEWEMKGLGASVSRKMQQNGHQHQVRGIDLMINNFFPVGVVDSFSYKDGNPHNLSVDNLEVIAGTYVRKTWKAFARACHIIPAGPGQHPQRLVGFNCQQTIDDCAMEHGFYIPRLQAILDDYMHLFWKDKCQSATCGQTKPTKLYWTLDGKFIALGTKQRYAAPLDYNGLEKVKPMCGYCTNVPDSYE